MSVKIVQDDTRPSLEVTLTQDGKPADLTGCTVKFYMKDSVSGSVKISGATCVITNALKGQLRYNWIAADTNTAGSYLGEFEVTYPDGSIQTNFKQIAITIRADV